MITVPKCHRQMDRWNDTQIDDLLWHHSSLHSIVQ